MPGTQHASPPWALGAPRQEREGGGRCLGDVVANKAPGVMPLAAPPYGLRVGCEVPCPSCCLSLVLTRRERESERSHGSPGERHLPGPSVPPVRGVRGEAGAGWTNAAGEVRGAASRRVVLWEGMAAVRWSRGGVITTHGRRRGGDKVPKPWQASPPWALGAPRQGREGGGRCQGPSEHHLPGPLVFPVGNGRGKAGAGWTFFATGHGQ